MVRFFAQKSISKGRLQMRENNKEYLCPKCKTGQDTYLLDNRNPFCPYLSFHNGDNCSMFKPMSKSDKNERRE